MTDTPSIVPLAEDCRRALVAVEIRRARLKLAIRENDLAWLQGALAAGHITVDGALAILDDVMDDEEVDA